MKKPVSLILSVVMLLALLAGCGSQPAAPAATEAPAAPAATEAPAPAATETPAAPAEPYEMDASGSITLKATGMCTYSFEEEREEAWADNVSAVYVREMMEEPYNTPLTDADLVDDAKYTVGTAKFILDSDIFSVDPSTNKEYEVTVQSEGYDDYHLSLTIKNLRPNDFTIRTIDGEGNVVDSKTFTYAEMEAMCVNEDYYTAACVMHGMNSYHAKGVYLSDLLAAAGIEFAPGMSLAMRSADAAKSIEATEINNGSKPGFVFDNTESYWMKARYTNNWKLTYEYLYGEDHYFISAPWEDSAIGEMLAADGAAWSIDARIALYESGLYEVKNDPMIAIQYESFEYNSDPRDPRANEDVLWKLSPNERGFAFVFGVTLDDDTTVNWTKYDDEAKEYPLVTDTSYAGKTAFSEGFDPCGTAARITKLMCGIDIFLDGGVE